jgi:hypothetical protein
MNNIKRRIGSIEDTLQKGPLKYAFIFMDWRDYTRESKEEYITRRMKEILNDLKLTYGHSINHNQVKFIILNDPFENFRPADFKGITKRGSECI